MNAISTGNLILAGIASFGSEGLIVLGSLVGIIVGLLIWKFGVAFFHDESFRVGGFYLRKVPYAGYKRFHSQKWNMEHMP